MISVLPHGSVTGYAETILQRLSSRDGKYEENGILIFNRLIGQNTIKLIFV
jgi:hypothetical protein